MFFLGIDGGGTKTEAVMMGEDLKEIARFKSGPLNFNGSDKATVNESIRELFASVASERHLGECKGVCMGMAGISNPDAVSAVKEAVGAYYDGELILKGDQETALAGALDGKPGLVVIAGTGSICVGRFGSGELVRAGGYGNVIDDGGSGYAIGRDILAATVRAYDGRGEKTVLSGLVRDRLTELGYVKAEDPEAVFISQIIRFIYDEKTTKRDIAAFSVLIAKGIEAGDKVSLSIAERAADELVLLAKTVIAKAGAEGAVNLAYSGSVLGKNKYINSRFTDSLKALYRDIKVGPSLHDAAYGAGLIACDV